MARDVTWFVRKHGYFPSYNIPFFKKMYKLGGFDKEAEKADWFSWEKAPRSRIMRRDHHRVVNIETLTKLMRFWWHTVESAYTGLVRTENLTPVYKKSGIHPNSRTVHNIL